MNIQGFVVNREQRFVGLLTSCLFFLESAFNPLQHHKNSLESAVLGKMVLSNFGDDDEENDDWCFFRFGIGG